MQAAYEAETITLDQLLEAQRRRADAQTSYFRTLVDYQRAIVMVHYRKGSLLEYNNVYLTEGPWPEKAKFDAHRLARQRDASLYINYGFTRPAVISQGAVRQTKDGVDPTAAPWSPTDGMPHEVGAPEELPTGDDMVTPTSATGELDDSQAPATGGKPRFEWGPLGLDPDDIHPEDPPFAGAPGAMPAAQRRTRSAQRQPMQSSAARLDQQPVGDARRRKRRRRPAGGTAPQPAVEIDTATRFGRVPVVGRRECSGI